MLKTFIISFKLKNAYLVNSIIYSIREFPFVKKILSVDLYKNKILKILGNIIAAIIELCGIFFGKLFYVWLCIGTIAILYKTNSANNFIHIFVFLTLVGAFVNTYMFNPTKDKYYAMMIMNMNAKEYTLSNYFYSMIKVFIGFLPFTLFFGMTLKVSLGICLLLPIFVIMIKMTASAYTLINYKKTSEIKNENTLTKGYWIIIAVLLILGYGLPYLGLVINQVIFIIIFIISLVSGIFSLKIINQFDKYKQLYKQILNPDNIYMNIKQANTKMMQENVAKQIELDNNFVSTKLGFAYFHELFIKRHNKILTKAVKKQAIVIIGILVIIMTIVLIDKNIAKSLNNLLLVFLPYFVFIMYMLNRGTTLTQAMFMNCDHSMLTYRIYRTPKVILGLFKERLKTLVAINLLPAFLIGGGLSILLYLTGGTNEPLNYVILLISIMALSVFFSVHYLVMYYLLQPYNINTEMKSSIYKVVSTVTYLVCYFMINQKIPTLYFGVGAIIFSILYSLISLFLVYKYSPKTFKLRS